MSSTVFSPTNTSLPSVTGPGLDHAGVSPVAGEEGSLRMTVPSPMVSRSVHTGTCREKIATPRPTFAPNARRYST